MKLHIAPDEKVIDRCINNFEEAFPKQNKFLILVSADDKAMKYVNAEKAFAVKYDTQRFWDLVGDASQYDSIIIHSFDPPSADFVIKIDHPNIYWIEWGADLYVSLLYPQGYELFYEKDIAWKLSRLRIPYFLYRKIMQVKFRHSRNKYIKAARKVKYFVPDSMYDEYPLLLQYYPELSHLEYKEFYYYPIDEVVPKDLLGGVSLGDNIIVGNSASLYGNHKLVFEKLSNLHLDQKKIIVPLSYGLNKVTRYVKELGVNYFGDMFHPITDYMPLKEYNKLLASASVFIYGNWRQEAVGNILAAMYIGGKVFLDKRNPLLQFYKNSGLIIFDLDELSIESINKKLSYDEVQHNRSVLDAMYNRDKLIKLIRNNF